MDFLRDTTWLHEIMATETYKFDRRSGNCKLTRKKLATCTEFEPMASQCRLYISPAVL